MKYILIVLLAIMTNSILISNNLSVNELDNKLEVTAIVEDTTSNNQVVLLFGIDTLDESNFKIEFFESISNLNSANYTSKPVYKLVNIGIQRGLNIASLTLNPLRTDPTTNNTYKLDSVKFTYNYNKYIELQAAEDIEYFTHILNKNQIQSLRNSKPSKKRNQTQSSTGWYNPDLEYFKFYSNKDGIVRINQSELIAKDSKFIGKNINEFQIFNRGEKVKFYSTSNAVQHGSYIYFVGSHAKGDTSYYDYYNGKEPYFIVHNPAESSENYQLIQNNPIGNKLTNVQYDHHFEKDKIYGNGANVVETEQVLCENWFWGEVRTPNEFNIPWEFYIDFPLFPDSDISIDYEYASNIFFLPPNVHNKTLSFINNYGSDTITNNESGVITSNINVPKQELINGLNHFNFNSYKAVEENQGNNYNGVIGFDYFNVTGKVLPIANEDYFSFINNNSNDSYVEVEGFSDNFVVVIDTVNNTIQFPNTTSSSLVALDIRGRYTSIYFNKPIYSNFRHGFHIVTNISAVPIAKYFNNENDFINYFDKLSNYNDIAIAINLEKNISNSVKDKINSKLSANSISSASSKYMYIKSGELQFDSNNSPIFQRLKTGNYFTASVNLPKGNPSRKIVNSLTSIQEVKLEKAKIKKIEESDYDVFYIYHPIFESTIDTYVSYLTTKHSKKALKIDVEQLYDTYGYGIESPHSIRNFLKESYESWVEYPEYLTLVGDGTWDPKLQREGSFVEQLIPTYGIPYSDNFYGMLDGDDLLPELIIGRLPVNNNTDLTNYLDKVQTYYNAELNPWMKSILQIAGGDANQLQSFRNVMNAYNQQFKSSNICPDTVMVYKDDGSVVTEAKAAEIKAEINEGKMWTNFLGHGSPTVIDMAGWEAPNLNNKGKYGFLNTLSCNTSAFAEPWQTNTIGEDFVNIKDKGFIAVIGGTSTTSVSTALVVASSMFFTLLNEDERNIGKIFNSYKPRVVVSSPHTVHQVVLLGDPLIDIRIPKQPEIVLFEREVITTNEFSDKILNENNDFANVKIKIYNLGTETNDSVKIKFIHKYENEIDTIYKTIKPLCFDDSLTFNIPINKKIGLHSINIFADYDSTNNDIDYSNNQLNLTFNVFSQGIIPVEPLDNWDVSSSNPIFRFVNPTQTEKDYSFEIKDDDNNTVYSSNTPKLFENYVEINPTNLTAGSDYTLKYQTTEKSSGITSDLKIIEFHTMESIDSVVNLKVNANSPRIFLDGFKLENNELVFDDINLNVHLSSARGSMTDNRHVDIITYNLNNNKEKVYRNGLARGFNLILLPPSSEDTTYIDRVYDTWQSNHNEDIFYDSRMLNKFINDTLLSDIYKGYYLLLATCDVPMRAPDIIEKNEGPDSLGSSSSIKKALNSLGAKVADSLQFNSSYVLFTRIGYPETTIDRHNIGDSIQLDKVIDIYRDSAMLSINNIGPAKEYKNSLINIAGENYKIKSDILTLDGNTAASSSTTDINLSNVNAKNAPYVNYNLTVERDSIGANFIFKNLKFNFVNTPELAVIKSLSDFTEPDFERAFYASYNYALENISSRNGGDSVKLGFDVVTNFNTVNYDTTINRINKNGKFDNTFTFNTLELSKENVLQYKIDPQEKQNELYTFNNIFNNNLIVREDTTKPYLKVYADAKEIFDKDYVAEKPEFTIELYDNSPQEILKENVIFVRINRKVILKSTTDSFQFEILNQGNLKARLTFVDDTTLDIGENSLQIIAEDASGNHADTLDLDVFVSGNYEVSDILNYPNPFEESTTFKYDYLGKENEVEVQITIYDGIGARVRKLDAIATFGENELIWDGRTDDGNSISSGVYYYRMDIIDKLSSPKFGRMIKVR